MRWYARLSADTYYRRTVMSWTAMAMVLLLYSLTFIQIYAKWQAQSLRAGDGPLLVVTGERFDRPNPQILLGTTNRLMFLYDRDDRQVSIVPYESVHLISVEKGPRESESEHNKPAAKDHK